MAIALQATDADGDLLTYTLTEPAHGTLIGVPPHLVYRPHSNYFGADVFTFKVSDAEVESGDARIDITVTAINDPPSADTVSIALDEDTAGAVNLQGNDPEGHALSYIISRPPAHGVLVVDEAGLVYYPNTNYNGSDVFTYKVHDGELDSAEAEVKISVRPVNDAPVAADQFFTMDEDSSVSIKLRAVDPDGDTLVFQFTGTSNGTLTGTAPDFYYTPNDHFFGTDEFSFEVSDGQLVSERARATIVVNPVNDAPVAAILVTPLFASPGTIGNVVLAADGLSALIALDGTMSWDVEGDPLTFEWLDGAADIGAGARITNVVTVGSHLITLVVSDGEDFSLTTATLEVIAAAAAVESLIEVVDNLMLPRPTARPLIASLKAAAASLDAGNFEAGVNKLRAFQNKVRAQVAPADPVLAQLLIENAQMIVETATKVGD